MISDVR